MRELPKVKERNNLEGLVVTIPSAYTGPDIVLVSIILTRKPHDSWAIG
jgi:hypothetical protein